MNETMKTLLARRSCRSFKPEQIGEEELAAVLEAGKYAPTGMGRQSPIFVVVQEKALREKISAMNAAPFGANGPKNDPFYGAPTVVLVLADRAMPTAVEDGSLAIGNMLNAAFSLGLGSCWIHRCREMFESEDGKAILAGLGIAGDYIGVGCCILGYPAVEPAPAKPRKEDFVYRL